MAQEQINFQPKDSDTDSTATLFGRQVAYFAPAENSLAVSLVETDDENGGFSAADADRIERRRAADIAGFLRSSEAQGKYYHLLLVGQTNGAYGIVIRDGHDDYVSMPVASLKAIASIIEGLETVGVIK